MIRTLWTGLVVALATVYCGSIVIIGALLGRKDSEWYARMTAKWARAIIWASGCPVRAHGLANVHPGAAQVIVANHVSWFDVFAIASVLEVPFHFIAKKELERIPLFGPAWKAAGHISIDRSNREAAVRSLREAGEKIRRDASAVIIFAEGTRSRDGSLQPFKKGAFQLASGSGAPIVPTVVTGSFDIMPPGSWIVHPRPIDVHFLPPVDPENAGGAEALMNDVHGIIAAELRRAGTLPPR